MLLTNIKEHKPEGFRQLSQAVVGKFENNFWYLTEHLVVLSLFSEASVQQKPSMARAMERYDEEFSFKSAVQQMPLITPYTQLNDLIGPESWLLFKLINEQPVFFSKPASLWEKDKDYIRIKSRLLHLNVVNDSSKRALELVTDYHLSVVKKPQTQKQFLYQVVKHLREKQNSLL